MSVQDTTGPVYHLSRFQHQLILTACPRGTRILDAHFVRDRLLPCPVWVRVALGSGAEHVLLLRLDRSPGGVEREARLLPLLARLGVPVAEVLAGPTYDPAQPERDAMAVYSVLPGRNLLHLINHAPANHKPALANLLLEGIFRLQALTPALAALLVSEELGALLPRRGLRYELTEVIASQSWADLPALRRALEIVTPLVEQVQTPPCFWNGDFNPANFLSDGQHLTGFVDFAHACWHDPH
ncbi:MAG TPA: phosphotransferase, partial [Chloroflexota bacterium]|nr:phosphotransferase [Chloroflexota bacterium]